MRQFILPTLLAVTLVVAVLVFIWIPPAEDQWQADCEASGGEVVELSSLQYCKLNGEVYPRQ